MSETKAIELCMKMHADFLAKAEQMLKIIEQIKTIEPQTIEHDDGFFDRPWCYDGSGRAAICDDSTMIECDEALSSLEEKYITQD